MKKSRWTTLCLLLFTLTFCACGATSDSSYPSSSLDGSTADSVSATDSLEDSSSQDAERYGITYQGVKNYDKSLMEIPSAMMPAENSYPTQYTVGENVVIDPLQYCITPAAEYQFLGYFQDAACTQSFDETAMTGETVIYALIQIYYTTPNV